MSLLQSVGELVREMLLPLRVMLVLTRYGGAVLHRHAMLPGWITSRGQSRYEVRGGVLQRREWHTKIAHIQPMVSRIIIITYLEKILEISSSKFLHCRRISWETTNCIPSKGWYLSITDVAIMSPGLRVEISLERPSNSPFIEFLNAIVTFSIENSH